MRRAPQFWVSQIQNRFHMGGLSTILLLAWSYSRYFIIIIILGMCNGVKERNTCSLSTCITQCCIFCTITLSLLFEVWGAVSFCLLVKFAQITESFTCTIWKLKFNKGSKTHMSKITLSFLYHFVMSGIQLTLFNVSKTTSELDLVDYVTGSCPIGSYPFNPS